MPIFDQGYQHWQGPLAGHGWRWLAIARHGMRVQMKNRILRLLVLLAWLPALGLIVAVALWGMVEQKSEGVLALVPRFLPRDFLQEPRAYRWTIWTLAYSYFFKVEVVFIMLLVVVAGPGLISRDLRFNALPLYFSRPLTRLDYFLGKLGVIGTLVAWVAVGPAVFAYFVGVCFSLDLSVVKDTYPLLLASVAYGLVVALSVGTLILALSSLTRRSPVGIAWAGLWIISGSVGSILVAINGESVRRGIAREELSLWLEKEENRPPPGVVMHGPYPAVRYDPRTRGLVPVVARPEQEEEAARWHRAYTQAGQQARMKALGAHAEGLRRDWRPLCSYVANLNRIADLLLDTHAAWATVDKAVERSQAALGPMFRGRGGPPPNEYRLADQQVAQYPWAWSAGVLAGLLGLSTWTLTRRVKSLDRLR